MIVLIGSQYVLRKLLNSYLHISKYHLLYLQNEGQVVAKIAAKALHSRNEGMKQDYSEATMQVSHKKLALTRMCPSQLDSHEEHRALI